jgi:hypothetical protein
LCVDEDILYIGGVKVHKVRTSGGSEGSETVGGSGAENGSRPCGRAYRKDIICYYCELVVDFCWGRGYETELASFGFVAA